MTFTETARGLLSYASGRGRTGSGKSAESLFLRCSSRTKRQPFYVGFALQGKQRRVHVFQREHRRDDDFGVIKLLEKWNISSIGVGRKNWRQKQAGMLSAAGQHFSILDAEDDTVPQQEDADPTCRARYPSPLRLGLSLAPFSVHATLARNRKA
eukprot:scaffold645_cov247-Pinguiococcus_pyrenoidosus.AAC.29